MDEVRHEPSMCDIRDHQKLSTLLCVCKCVQGYIPYMIHHFKYQRGTSPTDYAGRDMHCNTKVCVTVCKCVCVFVYMPYIINHFT